MRALPVSLAALVLGAAFLASCQRAPDATPPPGNQAQNEATPPVPPDEAKAVKIDTRDDALEFSYAWPAQAAAIPALDQWLRGNMDAQKKRATAMARQDAEAAKASSYPYRLHSYDQSWSVAADTPALLVLEASGYEFTGGAHGNPFVATLIWDKAKQQRLATTALLDPAALARLSKARYCKALDAQRAEKRGAPVDAKADSAIPEFVQCVPLEKQEIVPVSKNGKAIDLIRILIMPYEAGPYSEGTYTIDLPVDAALMGAVKPAWNGVFGPAQ